MFGENEKNIVISFEKNDLLADITLAHATVEHLKESLRQYGLFDVREVPAEKLNAGSDFQVKVIAVHGEEDLLFISLYQDGASFIWSDQQKVKTQDEAKVSAIRTALQLFRNMMFSAATKYEQNPELRSHWWYASSSAWVTMESRNQETYQTSISTLQAISEKNPSNTYLGYALSNMYYHGLVENWIDPGIYVPKIGELANKFMEVAPKDPYALATMGLFCSVVGKKSESVGYFEQVLKMNPMDTLVRRYLTQIYTLVGKQEEALRLIDETSLYVTDTNQQPVLLISKCLIYLLQGKIDLCEFIAQQILTVHPATPFARLFMIACSNVRGDLRQSNKHADLFREYNPNFGKADLERFMKGTTEEHKNKIFGLLTNLF